MKTPWFVLRLRWWLFWLILAVGLEELLIIELSNVYLNGIPWEYERANALPFIIAILIVTVTVYYVYSTVKLRGVIRLNYSKIEDLSDDARNRLFRQVVMFPQHFFRFSILFLFFMSLSWALV